MFSLLPGLPGLDDLRSVVRRIDTARHHGVPDGVVLERNGKPPKEPKVATFKLAGLHDVAVTDRGFVPDPLFDPNAEKYDGVTLFVVDRT